MMKDQPTEEHKRREYGEMPSADFVEGQPVYHRGKLFIAGFTVILLLIVVIAMFSCGPEKGTILYGICKTYLEQNVPYPETIQPTRVEQYPSATRVYYTSVDAFGQFKMEQIECVYSTNENNTLQIDKVLINRHEEEQEKVSMFNKSLAAIVAGEPDLTLPTPLPDINEQLENLKN
jgi:hypothetical protein